MSSKPSHKPHYWSGQHASIIKRHGSRTAADCAAFLFPYLDKLTPEFSFLDIGCGPGSITTDLAQRYPAASFLGVDSGDKVIEVARRFAEERGTGNARFEVGDVMDLGGKVEWGRYDVVYCHQVLIHTPSPVTVLQTMRRAANPRTGLVAAREAFRGGLSYHPPQRPLTQWTEVMMDMIDRNGSDSATGRKLIGFALEAGWRRDQITHTCGANSINTPSDRKVFGEAQIEQLQDLESDTRKRLLESGLVGEGELGAMIDALKVWIGEEDAWAGFVNGEVVCRNG